MPALQNAISINNDKIDRPNVHETLIGEIFFVLQACTVYHTSQKLSYNQYYHCNNFKLVAQQRHYMTIIISLLPLITWEN